MSDHDRNPYAPTPYVRFWIWAGDPSSRPPRFLRLASSLRAAVEAVAGEFDDVLCTIERRENLCHRGVQVDVVASLRPSDADSIVRPWPAE